MYCVWVNNSWAWSTADIRSITPLEETYFLFLSLYHLQLAWLVVQVCCFPFSVTFVWFEPMKVLCTLEKSLWVHTNILYKFCRFLALSFFIIINYFFNLFYVLIAASSLCLPHQLPLPPICPSSWLLLNPIF